MGTNINSLESLRKRKSKISKKIVRCEEEIINNYYQMISPFSNLININSRESNNSVIKEESKESSFINKIDKTIQNVRRLSEIVKIGKEIYSDFKRK